MDLPQAPALDVGDFAELDMRSRSGQSPARPIAPDPEMQWAADDVLWDFDLVDDVVTWNEALKRRFGLSPAGSRSSRKWWLDHIHPDDRARVVKKVAASLAGAATRHTAEYRFRRADGSYAPVLDRGSLIRDSEGVAVRAIGAMIDLSECKQSEEALRLSEERFRLAATAAGLGIADIDMVGQGEHWSTELREMLGVSGNAPACMDTYTALIHPDDRAAAKDLHVRSLRGEFLESDRGMYRIVRPKDGGLRWIASERHAMRDDDGAVVRVIVTSKDITDEKTAQDRISWAATHDALTKLPSRMLFNTRLESALATARAMDDRVGLLLIDMDNLKYVNETVGSLAGDRALATFARRAADALRPGMELFRFDGDEFAAILPGTDLAAALATAGNLLASLRPPLWIGEQSVDLAASIGVSIFPQHGKTATEIIQNADLALRSAKQTGRASIHAFAPALRAERRRQLAMLGKARMIIEKRWIEPFYQPKIVLATGQVSGFEALLRWRRPRGGLQLPGTIAHAFADTRLAGLLGAAMADAVLADMRGWIDRGIPTGKIALNASAAEFRQPGYAERLLARLAEHAVPAALIELEITESVLLDDCAGNVIMALETLRAAGMTVALDDFGTGFSSLSHLRSFPVDTIKIDRSFVAGLNDSNRDRAIIEAVIRLARALGMTTVAEGIETREQADFLRAQGCMLGQGFLFAPAVRAAQAEKTCSTLFRSSSSGWRAAGDAG